MLAAVSMVPSDETTSGVSGRSSITTLRNAVDTTIAVKTILIGVLVFLLAWAVVSIRDTLLLVFIGIFLALVFEVPVRTFMRLTGRGRGGSATIVVLGTALIVTVLGLIFLVPLAGPTLSPSCGSPASSTRSATRARPRTSSRARTPSGPRSPMRSRR
jgi:hypothetical protein